MVIGADDRARDWIALQAGASSANAGRWRDSIAPWTKRACVITGSRGGFGGSGPERWKNFGGSTTSTRPARSVGDEKTDGTLSSERLARSYQAQNRSRGRYPLGSVVRKLNAKGCASWTGKGSNGLCAKRWWNDRFAWRKSANCCWLASGTCTCERSIVGDAMHAGPWCCRATLAESFPVALRAPCKPCQGRKQGMRSVTDVLIHGVTHVMIQNKYSPVFLDVGCKYSPVFF